MRKTKNKEWAVFAVASHELARVVVAYCAKKSGQGAIVALWLIAFLGQTYWLWTSLMPSAVAHAGALLSHLTLPEIVSTCESGAESGSAVAASVGFGSKLAKAFFQMIGKL